MSHGAERLLVLQRIHSPQCIFFGSIAFFVYSTRPIRINNIDFDSFPPLRYIFLLFHSFFVLFLLLLPSATRLLYRSYVCLHCERFRYSGVVPKSITAGNVNSSNTEREHAIFFWNKLNNCFTIIGILCLACVCVCVFTI